MPQPDPLLAFDRFKLVGEELAAVRNEFTEILETADLERCPTISAAIAKYRKVPGVYFWTALVADVEYKIYAGQTNSLGYRVYNYTAPFQPHSPNDFKLLIFRAFLEQRKRAAKALWKPNHCMSTIADRACRRMVCT